MRFLNTFSTKNQSAAQLATSFFFSVLTSMFSILVLLKKPVLSDYVPELLGTKDYYLKLDVANRIFAVRLAILLSIGTFLFFSWLWNKLNRGSVKESGPRLTGRWFAKVSDRVKRTYYLIAESDKAVVVLATVGISFYALPGITCVAKALILSLGDSKDYFYLSGLVQLPAVRWLLPSLVLVASPFFDKQIIKKFLFLPLSVFVFGLFLSVVPQDFLMDGHLRSFFPKMPIFYIFSLPLILLALLDSSQRILRNTKNFFSPFIALALLISILFYNICLPEIWANNFELGLRLPIYWESVVTKGSWLNDLHPTHGFWDFIPFWISSHLIGALTIAGSAVGYFLWTYIAELILFFSLNAILPIWLTFFICLLVGPSRATLAVSFFAILLNPRLMRNRSLWIVIWSIICAIFPFLVFPYGALCVATSIPLFILQSISFFKTSERKKVIISFLPLLILAFFFLVGPLATYFWGEINYFLESAKINAIFYANEWPLFSSHLVPALFANAIIFVPLIALHLTMLVAEKGMSRRGKNACLSIFMMSLIFVFMSTAYGFGRTDERAWSRQFDLLLTFTPVLMIFMWQYLKSLKTLIFICVAFVSLSLIRKIPILTPYESLSRVSDVPPLSTSDFIDSVKLGLVNFGDGKFSNEFINESKSIKDNLDKVLLPDETYFDLTMDGLNYFSANRPPVVEYSVYYEFRGEKAQFRAIKSLREHHVVVSLLNADLFDHSPSSLRTHYLYRYALLNGLPLRINAEDVLTMPPNDFKRVGVHPPDLSKALSLLDKEFPSRDLEYLPEVWGEYFKNEKRDLAVVAELNLPASGGMGSGHETLINLPAEISGVKAGILSLTVESSADVLMHITWTSEKFPNVDENKAISFRAKSGYFLLPLDSFPRWLLDSGIRTLKISVDADAAPFEIKSASLLQRKMATELSLDKSQFGN